MATTTRTKPPAKKPAARKTPAAKKATPRKAPAAKKTTTRRPPANKPAAPASEATSGHQMTLTQEVPVSRILPNVDNIRADVGDVTQLGESIRHHGVLEPLIGYIPTTPTDGYDVVLIAGHRRLAAAELVGLATVPMVIRAEPGRAELFELMLAENNHRSNLNPIEEALALQEIQRSGRRTIKAIAASVNRSTDWVTDRLALVTNLPEVIWDDVRTGAMTVTDATMIATAKGLTASQRKKLATMDADEIRAELSIMQATTKAKARIENLQAKWPGRTVTRKNPRYGEMKGHPAPLGRAEYGNKPGQVNRMAEMDPPDHVVVHLDDPSWGKPKVFVWHMAPHLLETADFVPYPSHATSPATPWADLDVDPDHLPVPVDDLPRGDVWIGNREAVHTLCPGHTTVLLPWRSWPVPMCTQPELHEPDAGPDWQTLQDRWREAREQPTASPSTATSPELDVLTDEQVAALRTAAAEILIGIPAGFLQALLGPDHETVPSMSEDGPYLENWAIDDLVDDVQRELTRAAHRGTAATEDVPELHWLATTLHEAGIDVPAGTHALIGLDPPDELDNQEDDQ